MSTIKQDIQRCDKEIAQVENLLRSLIRCRRELVAQQVYCQHEFTAAIKGYEHEGGTCIHCGINEVYAASQKIGAQYK